MILKPVKKKVLKTTQNTKETPKKSNRGTSNKLPSDEYKPMFPPVRILVKEFPSTKNASMVRQYVEMSVKRFNDDSALPCVFIQMYQESEFYTGYLKGKSVHFPLESLYDVLEGLNNIDEECDKRNIQY